MQTITLVTGNKGKLAEWQRLFPAEIRLENADVDLEEIQSLDLEAVVTDKAIRAYSQIKKPVIVEDISAGLGSLNGLPGPFIKFFEIRMGSDALFRLSKPKDDKATVTCLIAYHDGRQTILARSDITGKVVSSRGKAGFGFDHVFVPDGQTKTYAQMTVKEKDAISHRSLAIKQLVKKLEKL